jgi:cell division protein FtsL
MTSFNQKSKKEICNNFGKYNLLVGLGILVFGAFYLVIANQASTVGVKMNDLQNNYDKLQLENQALASSVSSLQSVARLEEESNRLQLVASNQRQYLDTAVPAVAMR